MADREKVMLGLNLCAADRGYLSCMECPYAIDANGVKRSTSTCVMELTSDAFDLLREYDTALKLMVLQYCTVDEGFYHKFMSAGEEAFRVLGIENGQSTNGVWEKWFLTNERGEDNA